MYGGTYMHAFFQSRTMWTNVTLGYLTRKMWITSQRRIFLWDLHWVSSAHRTVDIDDWVRCVSKTRNDSSYIFRDECRNVTCRLQRVYASRVLYEFRYAWNSALFYGTICAVTMKRLESISQSMKFRGSRFPGRRTFIETNWVGSSNIRERWENVVESQF